MAHFRAQIIGRNRSSVSRLGTKTSGMSVSVRGWNTGVTIYAYHDETTGEDVFDIASDGGSNSAPTRAKIVLDGDTDAEIRGK